MNEQTAPATDSPRQAGAPQVEITVQMVEAGVKWLGEEYAVSDRALNSAGFGDVLGLLRAILGGRYLSREIDHLCE